MELELTEEGSTRIVEGQPGQPFMTGVEDARSVIEACFSYDVDAALLYASNMPPAFFDLSSGQAGEIMQRLRNYRLRLAVVCPPGSVQFSSRFGEVIAEERRGRYFGVFETRADALDWLARNAAPSG